MWADCSRVFSADILRQDQYRTSQSDTQETDGRDEVGRA